MPPQFVACKQMVHNRGKSPDDLPLICFTVRLSTECSSGVSEAPIGMTFSNSHGARKENHHE
jgi:hypothetical protein